MNPGKNYETKPFPVVEDAATLDFDYTRRTTTLSFNWTSFELRIIYH